MPLTDDARAALGSAEDFADPFVVADGASYVAFATGVGEVHVQVARSADLASWTKLPDALPVLPAWASRDSGLTWAPSVLRREDGYVLYYTTRDVASGFQCIGRATAPRVEGPYVDASASAFVCPAELCGAIDPSPFVDDDGRAWLLWKSDENSAACRRGPRIWGEPLSDDGLTRVGSPTALLATDRGWEGPLVEGPSMFRAGGAYFLFYSANDYESPRYAIGYATCASPVGPCRKATIDAPFLASDGQKLGPGGQEFFLDASGRRWMAYHAWTAPRTTYASGGARSLRIAPLTVRVD
jgi:beta-xylosidase